jgi:hypothetical protein
VSKSARDVAPDRESAALSMGVNAEAFERICGSEPVLVDVRPAGEVVPGMTATTVLTSGAPLPWGEYAGGQRRAILGGVLYEGLATDADAAAALLADGTVRIRPCHDLGCVGSVAGIYTASMPVFVVENRRGGNRAFCNLFEGVSPKRLNYGVYDEEVRRNLLVLQHVLAPTLGEAVRAQGGIPLRPIMRRALHMGDELHSRNTAATLLFTRELFPPLLELASRRSAEARQLLDFLRASDYFFLRLSMAASKATADAAHGVAGSSVVTAMTLSCRDFAIRVSGLGDEWFRGPLPDVGAMKLFPGHGPGDVEFMGGESCIAETVGLGGFAQAAAFPLQEYQGGTSERMVELNRAMYRITVGEHPEFKIPYLGFRGTPTGIDVHRVVATGVTPVIDAGVAGKDGGQIGAGVLNAPLACFQQAADAHRRRYGV